jgi:hypothetical protein
MSVNPIAFETLESRTLFSASTVFDPTVKLDRLHVRIDLLKFRADSLAGTATLISDRLNLRHDNVAAATTVTPLIANLKSDAKQMRVALQIDRLNEAANALADESVIVTDLKQIILDRHNPDALVVDRAKLKTDRIHLQSDLIAGLDSRIATRQSYHDTLFNDGKAIVAAVQTDPNASATLKTDVQTWIADADVKLDKMAADLLTLTADRTKLVADLTASLG